MSAPTPINVDSNPEPAAVAVEATPAGDVPVANVPPGDLGAVVAESDGSQTPAGVTPTAEDTSELVGAGPNAPAPDEEAPAFVAEEHPAERAAEEISPDSPEVPGDAGSL
jgi:hypothetical protein